MSTQPVCSTREYPTYRQYPAVPGSLGPQVPAMCLPLYCLHRARQCKVGSPEWRRRQVPPELARLAEYPCESLSLGVVESTPRVPLEYL